ncbi:MAG: hypothetical protein KME15_14100 [Drouetiella hepatica Uher 2000/2452]|jgi:hypothetical protein|uniref:Uncharacterized protein n=1 Tax=Drouetiella hepatica Uher 2000/2452 TaxID=904376 RepID=A0A951QC18_9CYAN|nr:hypothetical protein [Drouetiella hepatica Uher 2000/2452]
MQQTEKTSTFQQAIEAVEALSLEDQAALLNLVQQRLKHQRREDLLGQVSEAERDYATGNVQRGSVTDLMTELDLGQEELLP